MPQQDGFLERLRAVVGAQHVLTRPQDTEPYFTDWRRQFRAAAECVLRPASTAEVAEVVRLCGDERVAVDAAVAADRRLAAKLHHRSDHGVRTDLDGIASPFQLGLMPATGVVYLETFRGCPLSCRFSPS